MGVPYHRDHDGRFVLSVSLDDETIARLMNVADMSHASPEAVAASLLHDVLKEDEDAHLPPPPILQVVGGTDTMN